MISTVLKCCIIFHAVSYVVIPAEGGKCFHPGQRLHSKAIMSNKVDDDDGKYLVNTIVTYSCDPGYQILNNESRQCLDDGTWNGSEPYCGVNVGSSAKVSTSNLEKIVSSDSYGNCQQVNASETIFNIDFNQSYKIDLMTLTFQVNESYLAPEYQEELVLMVTYNNSTLDPKVWDKTVVLLKHYSESSNNKTNVVFQYAIDNSSLSRQLSLKIAWPKDDFGLCGIAFYSNSAIPENWCQSNNENDSETFKHVFYEDKCYVVIGNTGKSNWIKANDLCRDYRKRFNSTLVVLNEGSFQYIQDSLRNTKLMESHYWILDLDMYKPNKCGRIYFDEETKLDITYEKCKVKLGMICQFDIPKCGNPDQKNGTMLKFKEGSTTAIYSCPTGNKLFELVGSEVRNCSKGRWSAEAPTCKVIIIPSTTTSEVDSSTETSTTVTNLSNCTTESNLKPSCESQVNAIYNKIIEITCIIVAVFVILICLTTGLALVYIKYYLKVK